MRRLGAVPCGDGTVDVCVWAPGAGSVRVRTDDDLELEAGTASRWTAALAEDLAGCGHDSGRLVVCAQNHDQVGNRALGDRLPEDALRVAAAVTLFSPCSPLFFMGEEWLETAPFQFFTHHIDPAISEATPEGRRRAFAAFASFSGEEEVPDPQAL